MMIPDVSRTKLLQAIEEYDTSLRDAPEWANWEGKDTYRYAIVHDDKRYPVKQIIRMATGATDFSGGEEANNYVTAALAYCSLVLISRVRNGRIQLMTMRFGTGRTPWRVQ